MRVGQDDSERLEVLEETVSKLIQIVNLPQGDRAEFEQMQTKLDQLDLDHPKDMTREKQKEARQN